MNTHGLSQLPPLIRIYSPYPPDSLTEGAFQVIYHQQLALLKLGFRVELVSWLSKHRPESLWARVARVCKTMGTDTASPEALFYPLDCDPSKTRKIRGELETADLGIYHFSFSHHWLSAPHHHPRAEKKTAVHFHNLESELFRHRGWIQRQNVAKLERHELELASLADELWFLSAVDHATYLARYSALNDAKKHARLRIVGPCFDPALHNLRKATALTQSTEPQKTHVGILGNYTHGPNRASLAWILTELAPVLQSQGFANKGTIRVAGAGVPPDLARVAARYSFIQTLGFVPNLDAFWSELSWMLVPQFGGSGVRIKLLEALSAGIPVLANQEAIAPLDSWLKQSPLLTCHESATDWATVLMRESPGLTRRKYSDRPFEPGLDGSLIYRFLLQEHQS